MIASINIQYSKNIGKNKAKAEEFLTQTTQDLYLRHECIEPLVELSGNFQMILFSLYSQQMTESVISHLKEKNSRIHFDGIYCAH